MRKPGAVHDAPAAGVSPFAHPSLVPQSWYAVARGRELRPGRVRAGELGRHRIALWRAEDGRVHALHARCAHLGADLSAGDLVEGRLRCPFHHWCYDTQGRTQTPRGGGGEPRAVFAYPTGERFGLVWVWNGPTPLAPLPELEDWPAAELVAAGLESRTIPCHPHLVAGNGLDSRHMSTLHGLRVVGEPLVEEPDPHRVRVRLTLSLEGGAFERALARLAGPTVRLSFTTWGGSIATVEGRLGPFPLLVVFAMTPNASGHARSRTQILRPTRPVGGALAASGLTLAVAVAVLARVLRGDRRVLDRLRFRPGLVPEDRALAALIRQVERTPVFDADPGWPVPGPAVPTPPPAGNGRFHPERDAGIPEQGGQA